MEYLKELPPIIAALISAVALIKVNRIDNQDRIRRSLWAMEEFLIASGKCLEKNDKENMELYTSTYMLINLYIDKELRKELKNIDDCIKKGEMNNARENILNLIDKYSKIYRMSIYAPRRRLDYIFDYLTNLNYEK